MVTLSIYRPEDKTRHAVRVLLLNSRQRVSLRRVFRRCAPSLSHDYLKVGLSLHGVLSKIPRIGRRQLAVSSGVWCTVMDESRPHHNTSMFRNFDIDFRSMIKT